MLNTTVLSGENSDLPRFYLFQMMLQPATMRYFELALQHQHYYISILISILISIVFIMLSTLNLPVRPSPQKHSRKHWLSDSELSQSQSQSQSKSSSLSLSNKSGSNPFSGWSNSEANETPKDIPSLGHIFPDSQSLVDFTKD